MKVAIASDHRGVRYKKIVEELLRERGHTVEDFGTHSEGPTDYPDFAFPVARSVSSGDNDAGVLICATGIGMSITANKVKDVRASLCWNETTARVARKHNDANVLCIGQDFIDEDTCRKIVTRWLDTSFEGGRHSRRIEKIKAGEAQGSVRGQ